MNTHDLKIKVEEYRGKLKSRVGHAVLADDNGPIDMTLIDALVSTVEQQERRLQKLEQTQRAAPNRFL
jgi:hypothetical protein